MADDKGLIAKITESITGAGGAIKGAVTAAREIQKMQIEYTVKEKTYELLDKLMDVQQQQMSLQELLMAAKNRIVELEDEKSASEQWNADKVNYELYEPYPGTIVYKVKSSENNGDTPNCICPQCYEKGIKSFLQFNFGGGMGLRTFICHNCSSEFKFKQRKTS